jgi:hypothetical protein
VGRAEPRRGALADALAKDLGRVGIPVLRLAHGDVGELERSIIGYLLTQGAELERQAAALEHRLDRVALDGGGPTALVAAIATFFGRAVALEGRRGDALAVHAPTEIPTRPWPRPLPGPAGDQSPSGWRFRAGRGSRHACRRRAIAAGAPVPSAALVPLRRCCGTAEARSA